MIKTLSQNRIIKLNRSFHIVEAVQFLYTFETNSKKIYYSTAMSSDTYRCQREDFELPKITTLTSKRKSIHEVILELTYIY